MSVLFPHPLRAYRRAREAFRIVNTWRKERKLFKNKQTKSLVRTALKVVGTALVTMGVIDAQDVPTVIDAVQAIAGGLSVLAGVYLSWKDKKTA